MANHGHNDSGCSQSIANFPPGLFTEAQRENGAVVLPVIASVYVFGALAYLCDTYFVPALERIAERLRLRPDIAGATFMAIGSSSPELFTSLIGVFVAKDDVGVGAIIGSAIFNIFFVIGCCILVSPSSLNLDVLPILRDSLFYVISLVPVGLAFAAGRVEWYVSLLMVCMYAVYVLAIYYSERIENCIKRCYSKGMTQPSDALPIVRVEVDPDETTIFTEALTKHTYYDGRPTQHSPLNEKKHQYENGSVKEEAEYQNGNANGFLLNKPGHNDDYLTVSEGRFESSNRTEISHVEFTAPDSKLGKITWFLGLPVICLYWITLPNPTDGKWAWLYPLTFVLSLFYIAGLSYLLVWMMTVVGYTIGVPDIVMGLLFIAAGSSIPDALASIIVARQGLGRMAVSNCIGSNVFDILLGLGLPWLLKTTVVDYGSSVNIISNSIKFTIFVLIGSVAAMLIVFAISRWKLRLVSGLVLLTLYVGFVTVAILFEMNVLGHFNNARCFS